MTDLTASAQRSSSATSKQLKDLLLHLQVNLPMAIAFTVGYAKVRIWVTTPSVC
jgi:hypothetical protein